MLSAPQSVKSVMPTWSTPWHLCWGMASKSSVPKSFDYYLCFSYLLSHPTPILMYISLTQETLAPYALPIWDPQTHFFDTGQLRLVYISLPLPRQVCFYLRQLAILINKTPKQDLKNASREPVLAMPMSWLRTRALHHYRPFAPCFSQAVMWQIGPSSCQTFS